MNFKSKMEIVFDFENGLITLIPAERKTHAFGFVRDRIFLSRINREDRSHESASHHHRTGIQPAL